ncbi:MAG: MFS transporter [Saccharofermentans sp.]|nr:MFS transporter [Saccharofermentans sp.]
MANIQTDNSQPQADVMSRLFRVVILIIVSFLISVASVSFAVHHMRLQFEEEFKGISDVKVNQVADIVKISVDGDELEADTGTAAQKYGMILQLMLANTSSENLSTESYGLFAYKDGRLDLLLSSGVSDVSEFAVAGRKISDWLSSNAVSTVEGDDFESLIVPITNSAGVCVGVFEYKVSFGGLYDIGDKLETRILISVIISVVVGVVLFVIQEVLLKIMRGKNSGANGRNSETPKARDKRITSTTIGFCFAIVLVVLLVLSNQLSGIYVQALESERADAMEKCAISSAAALSYSEIEENMSYMLPIYEYAEGTPYIVNIYTMAGDSFLRLYTSTADNTTEQFYLTGNIGDQYINCFTLQETAFTARTEGGNSYVCAIAPILSAENTVAGVLEIAMPRADFEATVNGMSLSWVFTIISIAISMGIVIFELNLFISTVAKGVSGNAPVLVMYGENANRFLSFFMAFGSIMVPITFSTFFKEMLEFDDIIVQVIIAVADLLFIVGFFGFSEIKLLIKSKLTSRIAVVLVSAFGYFLMLIAGIIGNPYVLLALTLPVGFCYGMPLNYLRDYRINAGRLGYKDFSDRNIHNIQSSSYFLGVSVGTVIAGICYERFGILIVSIISGAALILTAIGMIIFMQNNNPVKEAPLSISNWMQIATDKYAGKFLNSSFLILGICLSFLLIFIPNYLEKVGISLATSSFYFLLCWFVACIVCMFLKNRYAHILNSRARVVIQALAVTLGLLLFSLLPSAKMLVITVALLGVALGIHDFYYIYVLYLICGKRIKANLRKVAEYTFFFGMGIVVPVFMLAFMLGKIRIVMLVATAIIGLLSFVYPASSFSASLDDKDPSLKPAKKRKAPVKKPAYQPAPAPAYPQQPVADPNMPAAYPQQPVMDPAAYPQQPMMDPNIPMDYQQQPASDPNMAPANDNIPYGNDMSFLNDSPVDPQDPNDPNNMGGGSYV